jgi:hypothetical protein
VAAAVRRLLLAKAERPSAVVLVLLGAVLLLVSSGVHIHLWDIAYRHVPTLGPLFLVQGCSAVVIALSLAVFRIAALVLAALGLVLGTITGFALVLTVGLFNFKLAFISPEAGVALGVESAAVAVLTLASVLIWTGQRSPAGS